MVKLIVNAGSLLRAWAFMRVRTRMYSMTMPLAPALTFALKLMSCFGIRAGTICYRGPVDSGGLLGPAALGGRLESSLGVGLGSSGLAFELSQSVNPLKQLQAVPIPLSHGGPWINSGGEMQEHPDNFQSSILNKQTQTLEP